jgi:hypothetical protein
MKDKSTWLLGLVVLGFAVWYFIDTHQTQARQKHAAEIRQEQMGAIFATLTSKYNATTNWEASLPDRGIGSHALSIDVSQALIGDNQRPVLFECVLDDIVQKDGKTIAKLLPLDPKVIIDNFALQCSPEQVKKFTDAKGDLFFAVARCHQVQRTASDDGSFSVEGDLLDVVQLP